MLNFFLLPSLFFLSTLLFVCIYKQTHKTVYAFCVGRNYLEGTLFFREFVACHVPVRFL